MNEELYQDFLAAMGQEFGGAVSPPIPEDECSPHECWEAVSSALGDVITPFMLANLPVGDKARIADSFASWFECEPPALPQIEVAIARTLARWPVGSLEEAC